MPDDRSPAREVVLHIGSGKTGTSAVQRLLADRREELLAGGVLYPRAYGGVRHAHLSTTSRPDKALRTTLTWRRSKHDDPAAYRAQHRERLEAELAQHRPERVLFSDEGLYALGPVALASLRGLLDTFAERRTVVVYLRRQDEHLVSRYQQSVKTGCVETLAEFAARDHSNVYDYARRLELWSHSMEPVDVVVRPFDTARFVDGSLLADFVQAAHLPITPPPPTGTWRNESLDADAVEFLRILNLDAVETLGERPGSIDNAAIVARLTEMPRGPVLSLTDAELDAFAEQWEASNQAVAARFLGGAPLFDGSRRTTNTTTLQRLDPALADHLADLADLPPDRRQRVRAIAEREATRP